MRTWPADNSDAIERHIQQLRQRNRGTFRVYRCILLGFQKFVQQCDDSAAFSQVTIEAWLHNRAKCWPMHLVLHRARIVDRFLDFLASEGSIPANPLEQLRVHYGQRAGALIIRALLAADSKQALEAQRPLPRFASFLGERMQVLGHRYETEAALFLRFDRFLQCRLDLADQPLSFLYNTGARIQEALDVCPAAIRFDTPLCVHLMGKGRKERICPLWPETVALLMALLKRQPRANDEPLFVNRYGAPLGASGVRFKLAQYVEAAKRTAPTLSSKKVSPHRFRHATAVHLVAAGVDVTVIRSWLGHASLDTTNHYAQANLETKRKALETLTPSSKATKPPRWRRDASVLDWLDAL